MTDVNPVFTEILKDWRLSNDVFKLPPAKDNVPAANVGADATKEALHISELTHAAESVAYQAHLLEVHKRRPRRYLTAALERYNRLKEECL